MKRIILTLFAAAGLAVTAARADQVEFRGDISFGSPDYAPAYSPEAAGCWRDVQVNVWIPGHWDMRRDFWGRRHNVWCEGHYEVQNRRVWGNEYADTRWWGGRRWERERRAEAWREHEWREHEWREHERREHEGRGDWDRR